MSFLKKKFFVQGLFLIQKTKRAEHGLRAIQESGSWLSVLCLQSLGLYNILPSLPNRSLQTALSFTPLSSQLFHPSSQLGLPLP